MRLEGRELTCVKNWRPALPYMCRSPWKEPLQPVKEKNGSGTGMGTLMPTIPTSTCSANPLFSSDITDRRHCTTLCRDVYKPLLRRADVMKRKCSSWLCTHLSATHSGVA